MTPTRDDIDYDALLASTVRDIEIATLGRKDGLVTHTTEQAQLLVDAIRALRDQREEVSVVKESLTTVPADVMAALDRMCVPLDDSWLGTASETAKADARCMSLIREYVMALGGDQREALVAYADDPVPAQPAVVPTYEIVMSSGRKARLTAPELVDRLAACTVEIERLRGERKTRPAVVPEGLANAVLANIAAIAHCGGLAKLDNENALSNIRRLSKPWCDNTGTLRDLKNRVDAAILSATEERKDA